MTGAVVVVFIGFGGVVTILDGLVVLDGLVFEILGLDGLGLAEAALEGATGDELALAGVSLGGRGLAVVHLDLGDVFLDGAVGFFGTDTWLCSGFFLRGLVLAVAETEGFFL